MAGAGYKLFNTGDVLTAAQVNTYLQEQAVMRFANAAARTTALSGVLAEGMVSYLQDTNAVEVYDGSAWVGVGNSGDITGVTAGTGISGGGTSGTVTITNAMATEITASGDIIVGTGSGTFDNLPIGTTGQVLTADTTVSPYKVKWATPSSSGGKISQVVVSNLLTTATTTSTSFVDTGLSVTITPSSTSSTIIIYATVPLGMANAASGVFLTLANGAGTNLLNPTSAGSRTPSYTRMEGADQYSMRSTAIVFQHSPASTSAQTYKVQFKVTGSTGCVNRMGTDSNAADYSQGISTIVAYEVTA